MQGHFCYSEKLITDVIAYYKALDGGVLSPQEAEQYLDSLAELWNCLVASIHSGFPPSRSGGGERAKHAAPEPSALLSLDN